MKIIAHRGLWKTKREKNSLLALKIAIEYGYGIETDIRDYKGELVISHDIADADSPLLEEFFRDYQQMGSSAPLALNVKADGMQGSLMQLLKKYSIENYFMFDMSIPEMVLYKKYNINYFTRHSDIEEKCVLYEDSIGVWLDSFYEEKWLKVDIVKNHLQDGKRVCVISQEIHGFDENPMWEMLREVACYEESLMLCTDKPKEAEAYFNGED